MYSFFGVQYIRSSLFLTGFYSSAIIVFIIIRAITARFGTPAGESNDWLYTILIPAFSTLGGLVTMTLVRLACILIGALFFYNFLLILLFIGLGNLLPTAGLIVCYIVAISLGAILVNFQEWFCVVGGSSMTGSMSIFLGIDVFVQSGFIESVLDVMMQGRPGEVSGLIWGFVSMVIIFAAIGSIVQNTIPYNSTKWIGGGINGWNWRRR